jgi:leucyl aminopeptidase
MKFAFTTKAIDAAPKEYARIRIVENSAGTKQLVKENGIEWIEIGIGKQSDINRRKFVVLCRSLIQAAKQQKKRKIAVQLDRSPFPQLSEIPLAELASLIAQNFEMANFEFTTYKTKPKDGWGAVEEVLICGSTPKEMQAGFVRGQTIGQEVNACRALANTPGGIMTPRKLAGAAKESAKGTKITVKTLGRTEMQKLGMGALLGVAAGSDQEPTFTIMEYRGGKPSEQPIVLAGKGITFDSGGLNLKPSNSIYEMHMDMSGAAAVIHATVLAAKLGVQKNVIALIPSAENMPGSAAYRPGDILKSLSGKTIEVLNTDAEGRLVLADAITYAKRFKPGVVIDVATLTGASIVALGLHASGLLTKDDALAETLLTLSETSGDYVWRLPMWDEYDDMVKGAFADLANIGSGASGRYGGATEGGIFLWHFAKELGVPWAHLDIAPRMTSTPADELAKGAAGAPVRLLLSFIESWQPSSSK